jgi:hypothetical protein
MGMFDHIKFEDSCWRCGTILTNWQSKDGPCMLAVLEPRDVMFFYEGCDICGAWNEFKRQEKFVRDEEAQNYFDYPDKRNLSNQETQ